MAVLTNSPVYSLAAAAEILGVSPHLLRLFEKEGLILSHRTTARRRMYSEVELAKAKSIQRMMRENRFNFSDMRQLLGLVQCWIALAGPTVECGSCSAACDQSRPCWTATRKCATLGKSCRDCPVYISALDITKVEKTICFPEQIKGRIFKKHL